MRPHFRALIADDERLLREQLCDCLASVWPELEIVAQARNGIEAFELAQVLLPDVIFLDIRMPGMNGLDAAAQILEAAQQRAGPIPALVFLTAYDQYAIQAFAQGAIDYVLKPADPNRLRVTAARLAQRLHESRTAAAAATVSPAPAPRPGNAPQPGAQAHAQPAALGPGLTAPALASGPLLQTLLRELGAQLQGQGIGGLHHEGPGAARHPLRWIQVGVGTTLQLIPVEEVLFLISDEKYTRVQTARGEGLIRKSIRELVEVLDPAEFWQIHRSTVVRVRAIAGVSRDDRGRQLVALHGHPERLEVSRSYSARFKAM